MKNTAAILPCLLLAFSASGDGGGSPRAIVPVVGSTQGAFGSNFRTSLQIHNRSDQEMRGTIVIHSAGVSANPSDPSLPYVLEPRATLSFDDIVAELGLRGLGSMDFVVESGGVPTIVARAYDEKGDELGTTGVSVPPVSPRDALVPGERATLLAPPDMDRFRFNIGVRTLDGGARMRVRIHDHRGDLRADLGELSFPPSWFIQRPAGEFLLGTQLEPNDSVVFDLIEGRAILYGTATDNTTNDPNLQIVRRHEE